MPSRSLAAPLPRGCSLLSARCHLGTCDHVAARRLDAPDLAALLSSLPVEEQLADGVTLLARAV